MDWIKTTDALPERDPTESYSNVPCLVRKRHEWQRGENKGVFFTTQILCFNHEYEVWDDEDGDDYNCDIYDVEYWMPLPPPPKVDAP